jgi:outer membrane protein TolC
MKKIIIGILMLLCNNIYSQEVKSLSLEECIKIGLENSKSLKISDSKVKSVEAKYKETEVAEYPTLKFTAGYTRLSDVGAPNFGPAASSIAKAFSPILDNYSTKITLNQPIFTGFRLSSATEIAEYNKNASILEFKKDEKELILNIRTAYWNYYRALKLKENIQQNITMVEAHLNDVKNFYKNGLATDNDVMKVKVQLSNTKLLMIDAENGIQTALLFLNSLIGLPLNTKITLKDKPEFLEKHTSKLDDGISNALMNREELLSTEMRIKAANSAITLSKAGWYPQIFFFADFIYSNPNQRYIPQKKEFKSSWDLGITLSFDLWNWMLPKYQTEQAEFQLEQIKQSYEILKDQINLEVTQNYLNLEKMFEKINISSETLEQAELNYKITKEKYKNGLVSNSELIDAETAVLQANINYTLSIVDYEIAKAKYLKSISK